MNPGAYLSEIDLHFRLVHPTFRTYSVDLNSFYAYGIVRHDVPL